MLSAFQVLLSPREIKSGSEPRPMAQSPTEQAKELGLEPEAPHNLGLKVLHSSPLLRSAPLTENFTCGDQVPPSTNLPLRTSLFPA